MSERKPLDARDVADDNPQMLANHIRHLQREVRDGFDSIARALTALVRIDGRLDVIIEHQHTTDKRIAEYERRIAALETPRSRKKK